jgi:DNA primase
MDLIQLAQQAGLNPQWTAGTQGGEYHTFCPKCGGKDRFSIQPHRQMKNCVGAYWCRKCGTNGDAIEFAIQFLNCTFQQAAELVGATIPDKTSFQRRPYINRPASLIPPPHNWIVKGSSFIDDAHKNLIRKPEMLKSLTQRGIPPEAVRKHRMGWSEKNHYIQRRDWGLDESLKPDGSPRALYIPAGLVIPIIDMNDNVIRLKVRRAHWKEGDDIPKYIAISGSMSGLSIIGSPSKDIVIVVESELDAIALHHAIDEACIIAVGSNIKNPDNVTDKIAKQAKRLIICHDNDEAGEKMFSKWKKMYHNAIPYPTPFGKDIGEAIQKGLAVRAWILEAIKGPLH